MTSEKLYPDLGSASDCLNQISHAARPIRSTTQIWVMTRHQYGISAFVSQTSFGGETSGSVAKCRLFSQASILSKEVFTWHRGDFRPRASSLRFPLMALYLFTWYQHKMLCRRGSPRFSYRDENFTPVRNLATVSCKRETTKRFSVKSVCR